MCSAVDARSFARPAAARRVAARGKKGFLPPQLPHPPQNPRGVGRVKMDILCNM